MKKKYRHHPADYAVSQTERFYADMAAKGWVLEKRGTHLSRFRREEPQELIYRLELTGRASFEGENALPEAVAAAYEAAGWTFVASKGMFAFFSAPKGTPFPALPDDPSRRAAAMKVVRRNAVAGLIAAVVGLAAVLFMAAAFRDGEAAVGGKLFFDIRLAWYTDTAKMLLIGSAFGLLVIEAAGSALHAARLHRVLRKGSAAGGVSRGTGFVYRAIRNMLLTACLVFALLTGRKLLSAEKYDMPAQAQGPYILLSELGWTGERTYSYERDNVSSVTYLHSLRSEQWYTREFVEEQPDGAVCMLRQEVYRLKSPKSAMAIVTPLMKNGVFARDEDAYSKVQVAGLDAAWESTFEYIAVKEDTVYYLIYIDSSSGSAAGPKVDILATLAKILYYRQEP